MGTTSNSYLWILARAKLSFTLIHNAYVIKGCYGTKFQESHKTFFLRFPLIHGIGKTSSIIYNFFTIPYVVPISRRLVKFQIHGVGKEKKKAKS